MPLSDFTIGKILGKGTFGSVSIVQRKIDNETYAMKSVKMIQLTEKEKQNALNEIRILASLNHKNIIGYKEAFFDEVSQTLNIIMEYADDGDLASKIKYNLKNGLIFHEKIIWNYLIQILEGINYLHENKIIHRDLKSANIFLMKDGTIKIGDLNVSTIAKMGIAFTQTGTPYYASPEVWMDKSYNNKSDIWSIGCIIYELCMLKTPFRGTSMKNLCSNIQKGVYPDIHFYSDELKNIIKEMLVVNPQYRLSAKDLLMSDCVAMKNFRENGGKKILFEEKADLIKTIKMPRNLREINRSLPIKRYNKIQKEEMLMNDEYETKKNGFFNNKDEIMEVKNYLEENKQKPHNVYNNNKHSQNNSKKNDDNNYNYNYNYNNRNNIKNPWDDNYKYNYEYHYNQQIGNNNSNDNNHINYNNNNNINNNYNINYLHNNNYNNKPIMNNNPPYNKIKNIEMVHNIHNYNYNYNNNNNNNSHLVNNKISNIVNNNNLNHPKTPNLISPYNNKYKFNNVAENNNNNINGKKVEISSKSRPGTGNNIIHRSNNAINNRVNRSNIKNVNINNNMNKKPSRPLSSAIPHRGGYMYKNNNNNNNNYYYNNGNNSNNKANINMSNNKNKLNRANTGNPNYKIINAQRNIINNNMRQYQNNNNNKFHQHNLNNDFKLRNGRDIVIGNPQNKKKKNVIIEKINYKPSKQNYNKKYSKNINQPKGKIDRMKEYEKERLKNKNNQTPYYNKNYVKK